LRKADLRNAHHQKREEKGGQARHHVASISQAAARVCTATRALTRSRRSILLHAHSPQLSIFEKQNDLAPSGWEQ
jgi:hypothetical protein